MDKAAINSHPPVSAHYDRLETLLKNLPGMAYRCLNLEHWPMEFVSDGCYTLCGYQRHEIESQQVLWGDFTHPDDVDYVDRLVRGSASSGNPFEVEYRIISREGVEKWVWERGRPVDYREDGVAILEGFITDITDRKQAENALTRAEAYSQAIVESAAEAVITISSDNSIETFNRAASRMFGYSAADIRHTSFNRLIANTNLANYERYFRYLANQDTDQRGIELEGRDKEGNCFPIHLSMQQFVDAKHTKYVILIRDLTEQRAAEREVRVQRDMLARTDRLNTLGEMTAGIAHEINQPLMAISMYAQSALRFLERDDIAHDRIHEAMTKLSQQAHRAGAIIERMQEMTRPGSSHHERVDTGTLISDISHLGEVDAQIRHFRINLQLDRDLPDITCDPVQIQQVLLNLLRNGMDSMTANHCPAGSEIILRARKDENRVTLSIIDSGTGIDRVLEERLYQPFVSTKAAGMGLGLAISRSIIADHGGQLDFHNNQGKGATFFFSLKASS